MLGNVVTGLTILGPAGMLAELAEGLQVGIHDTGLLVTYGAVVLFVGSPVMAWLTTRIDRRALLVGLNKTLYILLSNHFISWINNKLVCAPSGERATIHRIEMGHLIHHWLD